MNLKQLEHILRACGSITGCREIIVIGSQALLASYPDAPDELLRSMLDRGRVGDVAQIRNLFLDRRVAVEVASTHAAWSTP